MNFKLRILKEIGMTESHCLSEFGFKCEIIITTYVSLVVASFRNKRYSGRRRSFSGMAINENTDLLQWPGYNATLLLPVQGLPDPIGTGAKYHIQISVHRISFPKCFLIEVALPLKRNRPVFSSAWLGLIALFWIRR